MAKTDFIKMDPFILKKPHITEKASFASGAKYPVYTFEVPKYATKIEIKKAVEAKYNVKPLKVNIINLPKKRVTVRRTRGTTAAIKKALVYMPAGTSVDFI